MRRIQLEEWMYYTLWCCAFICWDKSDITSHQWWNLSVDSLFTIVNFMLGNLTWEAKHR